MTDTDYSDLLSRIIDLVADTPVANADAPKPLFTHDFSAAVRARVTAQRKNFGNDAVLCLTVQAAEVLLGGASDRDFIHRSRQPDAFRLQAQENHASARP